MMTLAKWWRQQKSLEGSQSFKARLHSHARSQRLRRSIVLETKGDFGRSNIRSLISIVNRRTRSHLEKKEKKKSLLTSTTNLTGATIISFARVDLDSTTKRTNFDPWRSTILCKIKFKNNRLCSSLRLCVWVETDL